MRRVFSCLLVVAMLLTMLPSAVFAEDAHVHTDVESVEASKDRPRKNTEAASAMVGLVKSDAQALEDKIEIDPDTEVTAIILLDDSLLPQAGVPSVAVRTKMLNDQQKVQHEISKKILNGHELRVRRTYTTLTNGFSARVTYGQLQEIRKLDNVVSAFVAPAFEVEPRMTNSNKMIGGGIYNETDYHGEGMLIAILDTGVDLDHEIFKDAPKQPGLTQEELQELLEKSDFQAEQYTNGVTASALYYSEKIPFQFDYGARDTDANPEASGGEHGTHVAATAAGNDGVVEGFSGVAPEAQIADMKVFDSQGYGSYEDVIAALEDCVLLNVDVANMSLGSSCGFIDYDDLGEWVNELVKVFDRAGENGTSISVAVGNDYTAAYNNNLGGNALSSNPDYGNASLPSTLDEALAVASVENDAMVSPYITVGSKEIAYYDGYDATTGEVTTEYALRTLASKGSLEYVMIDGDGEEEDYQDVNVDGKIAVVRRGGIYYEAKASNAQKAGAIGLIVYNNEPGMIYMSITAWTLPVAFISELDGTYLASQKDKHLTIAQEDKLVASPTAGMSDFSSWGATGELTLKPEISAPGGNIYSAVPGDQYELMSGTSMASPHVAGGMAIVRQAINKRFPEKSDNDKKDLVDTLLISTAKIVYDGETPVSPRKQGGGMMNINAAAQSDGYITVSGMERPKLELGDDVSRSGSYKMQFTVHNTGTDTLCYKISPIVLTDGTKTDDEGRVVMTQTDVPLTHTFTTNCNNNIVTVSAGKTAEVTVQVTLTNAEKELAAFTNGAYVEGWVVLEAVNVDGSDNEDNYDLNVPFLTFYGDWTVAPTVDSAFWWEESDDYQTYPNEAILNSMEDTYSSYLGYNNYDSSIPYLQDRNAISPNSDDFMDKLSYVYTGLLRNVRTLRYTITGEDGTVYYDETIDYETKSIYDSSYYSVLPAGAITDEDAITPWYGTDKNGSALPNNTKATVSVSTTLPYNKHESKNSRDEWSFPITVDTEAPEMLDYSVRESEGRYYADITVRDNQYVAAVVLSDSGYEKEYSVHGVGEESANATTVLEDIDVTGLGETIGVIVDDYAGNSKNYYLRVPGNTDDYADVVVTEDMILYKEDFNENWLPDGWTQKSESHSPNKWYRDEHTWGDNWACIDLDSTNKQDEWLITKSYDLSESKTPAHMIFTFETSYTFVVQYPHENVTVYVSKDGGSKWEPIWALNQDAGVYEDWIPTQAKVVIPDEYQFCKDVQFAFAYTNDTGGADFTMDDMIIYQDRAEDYATVTATAGDHGGFSPDGAVFVRKGTSKTFTAKPDEGYEVASMTVDGVNVGPISYYTFEKVGVDHTIDVQFRKATGSSTYSVLAAATTGGSITPAGTLQVHPGGSQKFAISALTGYQLAAVRVNGRSVGKVTEYTLENVDQNYYVQAVFEPIPAAAEPVFEQDFEDAKFPPEGWEVQNNGWKMYNSTYYMSSGQYAYVSYSDTSDSMLISPAVNLKGTTETTLAFDYAFSSYPMSQGAFKYTMEVSADGDSWQVLWDASKTTDNNENGYVSSNRAFVTIPEEYLIDGVRFAWHYACTGGSGIAALDNISLEAVSDSTEREGYAQITATAGEGGAITPSGRQYVEEGSNITFTVTPVVGYEIDAVYVDGSSVGAVEEYTFQNVYGTHTIQALFRLEHLASGNLFENDFEDGDFPSRGWTLDSKDSGDYTWHKGSLSALNETNVALVTNRYESWSDAPEQDEWLISPTVDLTGVDATLKFDIAIGRTELRDGNINLLVMISNDGAEQWTPIWNAKNDLQGEGILYTTATVEVEIDAIYQKANTKIAFEYTKQEGYEGDPAAIDNVALSGGSEESCSHAETERRNQKDATCLEDGYTGDLYCLICHRLLAVGNVVPATGHTYGAWEITAPATCTQDGVQTRCCTRCDATETQTISALGHDYETTTTDPTCTQDGYSIRRCTRCGDSQTEVIPALGHSYVEEVTEATCTRDGYTTHTCTRCGDSYTDSPVLALGHDWTEWTGTERTCLEGGVQTRSCKRCNQTESREVPALGHDYETKVVEPTCTVDGFTLHICTRCGDVYKDTFVPALGHTWDEGVRIEPDEFTPGKVTYTCTRCGETRVDQIPALGCPSEPFEDVDITRWYHKGIDFMVTNGYMTGVSSNAFAPDEDMSRGMLVSVLYRIAKKPSVSGLDNPFTDVEEGRYYTNAIIWAYANDVVSGVSDTTFAPESPITREQLSLILYRYDKAEPVKEDVLAAFPDGGTVSRYAKTGMNWAVANGLISGVSNDNGVLLVPQGNASRAQVARILMAYLNSKEG